MYKVVNYDDASAETRAIYDDSMRTLGIPFVLNWLKCQGENPAILKGNWEKLKGTLILGDVPNVLKQIIIHNISKRKSCSYCTTVHGIFANSMSAALTDDKDFVLTENLNSDIIPSSYKTAIKVVTDAALEPQAFKDEQVKLLQEEGFSATEIIELLSLADFVNMATTIAEISGIKVDNELAEAA
ncbi:alkylhydroperoxidase [Pelobium manganitolerans]|uniref:Alkylhydroperoxidase n=1 Tax=Pelobium manganitolerans TaxID=1842495 RepID=A0A419S3R9_9SPHI|nr:carboxymuconolactone decarboxylase family protein [Pelobium manganitolerans]RKD14310.1 alkylhydroperoxidase [Pelobium manganitolerans]